MKKILLILLLLISSVGVGQNTQTVNNKLILKSTPNLSVVDSIVSKDSNQMLRSTSIDDFKTQLGVNDYLKNLIEDLTPQLGGNLDLNNYDITGVGNINTAGNITNTATIQTANISASNNVTFTNYPNTRNDTPPLNILHSDISGNLLSSPSSYFAASSELSSYLLKSGGTVTGDLTVDGSNIIGDLRFVKSGVTNFIQCGENRVGSSWNDVVFSPYGTGANPRLRIGDTESISYIDFKVIGIAMSTATIAEIDAEPDDVLVTKGWVNANAGVNPYTVYSAIVTQTGTSAPVSVVLENTLGAVPVWSRIGVGVYDLTSAGIFVAGQTAIVHSLMQGTSDDFKIKALSGDINSVTVATYTSTTGNTLSDNSMASLFLEIRVYD